ncbi:uncharacterized protein LOC135207230 [Macrobrachium nipponense]|uniref:uncharacterized protein LOC135207230 n=1 Tax=Macrobrachium nipponense TaxID=159736 RepID=UPI0030C7C510
MGLTESNHSKATTGCTGPSKSRSTPHFPDSRGYQNRPRQAATLPARRTPESSQTPPYHHPRTPMDDPQPLGHDPRPPEADPAYRGCFVQVGRNPSVRPVATRRSASADSRKRRSDPLLDAKTLKQLPEIVPFQQPAPQVSYSHLKSSPPMSPRGSYQRPRPTAIYVADDHPAPLGRTREGRSRDRSGVKGKSRSVQKAEKRDRSRGSGERGKHPTHVSTYTMIPHCPEDSLPQAGNEVHPHSHPRHRRARHKSGERREVPAEDNLQGDPYVCLHYGGATKDGQKKAIQQVTAWRSKHQGVEEPPSPNHQMSQVVIHMDQVTATTLDNYDALNANIESIQVRRNVWFQTVGNVSEPPVIRKIASKAMRTPVSESAKWYSDSEMIHWPDVTNKVSSIYMMPEMQVANALPPREKPEIVYHKLEMSSSCQGCDHGVCGMSVQHHTNGHLKDCPQSLPYQASDRKGRETIRLGFEDEEGHEKVMRNLDYSKYYDGTVESLSGACERRKNKSWITPDHIEIQPPLQFAEESYVQASANGDTNQLFLDIGKENEKKKDQMELHFGINNHVEDYTIIEDSSNEGPFYGCRDSDLENGDSPSAASCEALLSDIGHHTYQASLDNPLECELTLDNEHQNDKSDKQSTTENTSEVKDNSLSALRDTELLLGSSSVEENVLENSDMPNQTVSEIDFEDFYKEQLSLVSEYLSLRDSCTLKMEEKNSDIYEKVLEPPEGSYPASTVPGSPSASAFSQKCLFQSTSLPRHLQSVNGSASGDSLDKRKAFRNKFGSFDLGHFPVLRLPLGNQPRLVDVLRATAAHSQESCPSLSETNNVASCNSGHSTEARSCSDPSSTGIPDPSVSYPDSLSSQWDEVSIDSGPRSAPSADCNCSVSIGTESCLEVECLPYADEDSQEEEECLSDGGCDMGTIMRGVIPGVTDAKNSFVVPSGSLSSHDGTALPIHDRRSASTSDDSSICQSDHGLTEINSEASNTWQSDGGRHVGSHRRSNNVDVDYPGSKTLQQHPKAKASSSSKRRTHSDCSLHQRPSSDQLKAAVPGIVPRFRKNVRRKPTNRKSLHSIDWDTPLPPVPANADSDCSYMCHEQCQDLVTLDCKTDLTPDSHTSEEDLYEDTDQGTLVKHEHLSNQNLSITVTSQEEEEEEEEETAEEDSYEEQEEKHEEEQQEKELLEEPYKKHEEVSTLRKSVNRLQSHLVDNETLEAWVEKYNATTQGLQIAKENDGSYRGCIRVHLNLSRPINIVAGTRPPSIYDILQEDRTMEKTLTSFYMPRDAVKAIHITSKTTTREVIIALLRKFKVVDNPQKFALYERTYDTGQPGKAKLRRLGDSECPLVLAINWSAQGLTNKRLVLQENDTADIQWEAFSLPELSNFLRILDREEEEYRCQIKDKYALLRRRIGNMLIQSSPE